jgi:pyruvate kinase
VIALTPSQRTANAMTVLAHVRPIVFPRHRSLEEMLRQAGEFLMSSGHVQRGEEVVFVAGVPPGIARSTNLMKMHRIGEEAKLG